MVNQAFIIVIAYRPRRRRRRRKIPGIGRYPMGPTKTKIKLYSTVADRFLLINTDLYVDQNK